MNERDERLHQFFVSYFNQDWDIGAATYWTDVIDEFLTQNSKAHATKLLDDPRSWLSQEQENLPIAFGCDYSPGRGETSDRTWVMELAAYLHGKLAN